MLWHQDVDIVGIGVCFVEAVITFQEEEVLKSVVNRSVADGFAGFGKKD